MTYELPKLNFKNLEPYISEEQLLLHHKKHHQSYVDGLNNILEKLTQARKNNHDIDMKAISKELSFHFSGHLLHSLFWENLTPETKDPSGKIKELIENNFNSIEQFKKEFSKVANSIEGSGWAILACDGQQPVILQIEKHNCNVVPGLKVLLVLDVWEHAYYLDYQNNRAKFVEAFWNIVNWEEVNNRL